MVKISLSSLACLALLAGVAPAQAQQTGNRANGRDYQPTPAEVVPAERQAGVAPPAAKQQSENRDLENIDRKALRQEGMSTQSVPDMSNPKSH